MDSDQIIFAQETHDASVSSLPPWKILIVDDDEDIHSVTKLALDNVEIQGRALEFLSAFSAYQAKEVLTDVPDIALIFLDVVMEHNLAGLDVVDYIRKSLNNDRVRIIIRTGEPGSAPERMIIDNYDINDYKEKTELNAKRLYTSVRSSLLQYEQLEKLYNYQHDLENKIDHNKKQINLQENALIASNKQAQMGDFLNMISHQWRQPLSRIAAVIGQMKIAQSLQNATPEEMNEMLDSAESHVQHLSKIIKDFQNLYREEDGKSYVTAASIIENTLSLLEESLESAGILVDVDTKQLREMPKLRSEMNQVFINIIKNALDAIVLHEQKKGLIEIRFDLKGDSLFIEIEDNAGFGDIATLQEKIFDPYISTDEQRQGKGLGLYICRMIVEKHCKGKIDVSEGKQGACFTIKLPIQSHRC